VGIGPQVEARLPSGFAIALSPGGRWLARPECIESIEQGAADVLLRGPVRREKRAGSGRGPVMLLQINGQAAIGKRAMHGGFAGRLLGGLYLGTGRALAQAEAAERLLRSGIPTPQVLAVGWRRSFLIFTKQVIVTRAIPGAENLYEVARQDAPWRRRRAILAASADLIRRMHDAGFLHADLNVANLVLASGSGVDRVFVVDLDRGRFEGRLTTPQRLRNLARLQRSYEKWIAGRWPLSPREEVRFLRSYCRSDGGLLQELRSRLLRYRRSRSAARSTSSTEISSRQNGFPDGAGGHSRKKSWRQGEQG